MKLYDKVFSSSDVNPGRQREMDLAKVVFVFLMAAIHCTIECVPEDRISRGLPFVFDTVIGGPLAAPILMFSMGACIVYARKHEWEDLLKRGGELFGMGFLLNLCRYTIPYLFGYALTGNYEKYILPIAYKTLTNDILQFAGLVLCVIGISIRLRLPDFSILLIGLICSVCGNLLNGMDLHSPAANIALGYLAGTEDAAGLVYSDFVLLNWLIVPICGYLFGKRLKRVKDKTRFYRMISPLCILVSVVYFCIGIKNRSGMFGDGQNSYYHIRTLDVLICIMTSIGLLGIYYEIGKQIPQKVMTQLHGISENITAIYCVHWVLVVWSINIVLYLLIGTQEIGMGMVLLLAFLITVSAIAVVKVWRRKRKVRPAIGRSKG